jgi:protein tyrosine/serine phosphatase
MTGKLRWLLAACLIGILCAAPVIYYRSLYTYSKRLRVVVPGLVYRSGQMTAEGFRDAIERYHLRTVINVQDEVPDPDLWCSYCDRRTVKERQLCESLGVHYVHLMPLTISRRLSPEQHPPAIDDLLEVLDQEASFPVLIHCHAGLHRTGVLTAVYRMEYQGWSAREAYREMRANGFGPWVGTIANDYVRQFVLDYQPRRCCPTRAAANRP